MKAHRAALYDCIGEIVDRHRHSADPADLLSALIGARPNGRALSEKELCGHVVGMIGAGNAVTGATLSWALVYGAHNPQLFASLESDPASVHNFALETLRLSSCAWSVTRTHRGSTELTSGGTAAKVRRRSPVMVYLRGLNRSPRYWTDPDEFKPVRHSEAAKSQQRALLPFGLGPRGCIGQHLAITELTAILPALAKKGSVAIEDDVTENPMFATRVKGGLRGRFDDRDRSNPR